MTGSPLLSDPDGTPRFAFGGEAKREKPIWEQNEFGPWQSSVAVVPVTGLRRHTLFEVKVSWRKGPPLMVGGMTLGRVPDRGMAANDSYWVDKNSRDLQLTLTQAVDLAVQLARIAASLLELGTQPDLQRIARTLRARIK